MKYFKLMLWVAVLGVGVPALGVVQFDLVAAPGTETAIGGAQNLVFPDDWTFQSVAAVPGSALASGSGQILMELGGNTTGTTIGMIEDAIAFTAGRGNAPIAEFSIDLKAGDFGNDVTAFFRRAGDTYTAAVLHADGSVSKTSSTGAPGTTTVGSNLSIVGGSNNNWYSNQNGESQFSPDVVTISDFAGEVRGIGENTATSQLLDVDFSITTRDTTVVESVVTGADDLSNNGTYTGAGDLFLLDFGRTQLDVDYDVEHDGTADTNIRDAQSDPGTIEAGTIVNAYMLRHDSDANATSIVEASITFDNVIIGLNGGQTNQGGESHATSFGLFNNAGALFQTGGGTFDFNGNDVLLRISDDRKTLTLRSQVGNSVSNSAAFDQLWVITAVIPEPTTATLGLIGMAGLMVRRRRAA